MSACCSLPGANGGAEHWYGVSPLLPVVAESCGPFLARWPGVDVDVTQKFQFGGMAALFNHDIDLLVTPDPIVREGIHFEPVFPTSRCWWSAVIVSLPGWNG